MRGRLALAATLGALVVTFTAGHAYALDLTNSGTDQQQASGDGSQFLRLHNSARADHGLRALRASTALETLARSRSEDMAAAHTIWHDYSIGRKVGGRRIVGENVGRGPTEEDIFAAFMDSASHRANVLRAAYSQVGIASVRGDDGNVYVTVIFITPDFDGARHVTSRAAAVTPAAAAPRSATDGREVAVLVELVRMDAR